MAMVNGTNDYDTLMGSSDADIIVAFGGNDSLFGFGGSDQLFGGIGADSLGGGSGQDTLSGDAGNDMLGGGRNADTLLGGAGIDTASYAGSVGGVSVNLLTGSALGGEADGDTLSEIENLIGSGFEDLLIGNDAANTLSGLGGFDQLFGNGGNDVLDGGADGDALDGGAGNDKASYAEAGEGIGVNLLLNSGGGGDTLISIENVDGSAFRDFLFGNNQANRLQGFDGQDRLNGLIGNDVLLGGDDNDTLLGGFSNDTINGGAGSDYMNGEEGIDTASYANSTAAVRLLLASGDAFVGDDNDAVVEFENIIGSAFADTLGGDDGVNVLSGFNGKDDISGGSGADILVGGGGGDLLIGESGNDSFDYTALNHGVDNIADFSNFAGNNDLLRFESDAFGNLPVGALAANRFVANAAGLATTLEQRFVYETDTGLLRYDANGSAAGGVTLIAGLAGTPNLTATDFAII